jgi:hypothetical protein
LGCLTGRSEKRPSPDVLRPSPIGQVRNSSTNLSECHIEDYGGAMENFMVKAGGVVLLRATKERVDAPQAVLQRASRDYPGIKRRAITGK